MIQLQTAAEQLSDGESRPCCRAEAERVLPIPPSRLRLALKVSRLRLALKAGPNYRPGRPQNALRSGIEAWIYVFGGEGRCLLRFWSRISQVLASLARIRA